MPKPFPAEFRRDVIAVARKGEASVAQVARDDRGLITPPDESTEVGAVPSASLSAWSTVRRGCASTPRAGGVGEQLGIVPDSLRN